MSDPVSRPEHYVKNSVVVGDRVYEPIDLCEMLDFTLGNAVKYLIRHRDKGRPAQDLAKARWYLERILRTEHIKLDSDVPGLPADKLVLLAFAFAAKNEFLYTLFNDRFELVTRQSIEQTISLITRALEHYGEYLQ